MTATIFHYPETSYNDRSARIILPLVTSRMAVRSVLDIGCGIGTWMKAALELGIETVLGVDGSTTSQIQLAVDKRHFQAADLTQPLRIGQRFDLVVCLEVGEHLPESMALTLVDSIVQHGDLVLFSAAVPGQEGEGHVNEQWPTFWKHLFEMHGYYFSDILRPLLWNNPEVDVWYKQNAVLAVKRGTEVAEHFPETKYFQDLVHPQLYNTVLKQAQRMTLFSQGEGSIKLLIRFLWKTIFKKMGH